jgi:hypothetical protein
MSRIVRLIFFNVFILNTFYIEPYVYISELLVLYYASTVIQILFHTHIFNYVGFSRKSISSARYFSIFLESTGIQTSTSQRIH